MTFDPATFMSQTTQGKLDTIIQQCPEGEFKAMIDDFDGTAFRTFKSKKDDREFHVFAPPFVIQDASVQAQLGRDKVTVFHKGMFLDLDSSGGLDASKGKNVDLGRLRESVGQNSDGPWSFNNLKGAGPVIVKVVHEADPNDTEKKYARVTKVVKLG